MHDHFRRRHLTVSVIAAALLLTLLPLLLLPLFSHHDCAGEDCPVCALLRLTERSLPGLGILLFCAKQAADIYLPAAAPEGKLCRSPVSRHDKMTD